MEPRARRSLQLGLILPRGAGPLAPLPVLAARAGWQDLWVPAASSWPAQAVAAGMRGGWIVDAGELAPEPASDIWIRGFSTAAVAAQVARVADRHQVSADAIDATAAASIRSAGAVPVFGPAPIEALLALLRDSAGSGIVCLPASPGRTVAEACARLANDLGLRAEAEAAPALVGTLEDCQRSVAELYAAGMRELRLRLPATPDIPDVIAQMSALRGEALSGLRAGMPRSPAPAAPEDWGGRT
ncbi:MAG TPA: hypothetical protein VND54_01915 [Candidatus Saccharimonadales bacterium]|nr:hypothetical protein [Candidatus Saccharimonadales bacterium]